ncbi:MAG: PIN domain-containing protein [Candidatus Aminicenantes bacterium]|nr:PIN domain-containing protein [Candidatus Aminicenantes bacterium]
MSKIFIDTNILVYSMDNNEPGKKEKCRTILKSIKKEHTGVISTQVLQEFYVTATKKLKVDPFIAKNILHSFEHFEIVTLNIDIIKEAVDCSILNKISFWDSLIITAAEFSRCEQVWTEDLNSGQVIRGVKIYNPLAE